MLKLSLIPFYYICIYYLFITKLRYQYFKIFHYFPMFHSLLSPFSFFHVFKFPVSFIKHIRKSSCSLHLSYIYKPTLPPSTILIPLLQTLPLSLFSTPSLHSSGVLSGYIYKPHSHFSWLVW